MMQKYKEVNGHRFVWADDLQAFELPLPVPGKVRVIFDEDTGNVVVVRERKAEFPDGTVATETLVYRQSDTGGVTFDADAARQRIDEKKLRLVEDAVDSLMKLTPLFALGVALSVIAFFYGVIKSLVTLGDIVAVKANMAMAEVAYYAVYLVALGLAALLLRILLPLLFGASFRFTTPEDTENDTTNTGAGDVYINVQNGRQSAAQEIVNKRAL